MQREPLKLVRSFLYEDLTIFDNSHNILKEYWNAASENRYLNQTHVGWHLGDSIGRVLLDFIDRDI